MFGYDKKQVRLGLQRGDDVCGCYVVSARFSVVSQPWDRDKRITRLPATFQIHRGPALARVENGRGLSVRLPSSGPSARPTVGRRLVWYCETCARYTGGAPVLRLHGLFRKLTVRF